MDEQEMKLPDGTTFPLWEDETEYTRVYHVACGNPKASDDNPGTEKLPFKTIGRAASVLRPGEKVIVHAGIYRECVRPARGGDGPARMIAYEAAPGKKVIVKASEVWKPACRPSTGWSIGRVSNGGKVWMADLPPEMFVGYNPFLARNMCDEYYSYGGGWSAEHVQRFLLRRGAVFVNGRPLRQVFRVADLAANDGAFWVEEPGLRIHFRLWDDADPAKAVFEVTVREQAFAPAERHLGYIRVKGFRFEHGADGVPVPQRALVSTTRGHHWIIEDNAIRYANAVGLDAGAQDWKSADQARSGCHIIRRNTVSDCGICGIAGGTGVNHTLVEDNLVERIGGLDVEPIWECAGLKFHVCEAVLIRRNVFRHIRSACGLWLDYLNRNCRVSGNVFADIETRVAAVYIEVSHEPNLVDNNIFWDIRGVRSGDQVQGGVGCNADSNEHIVIAHNFFCQTEGHAVSINLNQAARLVGGRVGLCRQNKVLNNVFLRCPKRILLGRREDNVSDGNLFDTTSDEAAYLIRYPDPQALLNLAGWREYYGLDEHSTQARIEAKFSVERAKLSWKACGDLPAGQPVEAMHEEQPGPGPRL